MSDLLLKMPLNYEPLRKNRWMLRFPSDLGIQEWWLSSANRPSIKQNEKEIPFLNTSTSVSYTHLLRGPAFQALDIANWRDYVETFGGTSTEKFKGSQYPKYEAPYIAKSYLSESENLKFVRVLGLSGYNAGPAWLITADKELVNDATKGLSLIHI